MASSGHLFTPEELFFLLIVEYVLSSFKTCKDWSLMCFPRRGIAYLFAYLLPIVAPMQYVKLSKPRSGLLGLQL